MSPEETQCPPGMGLLCSWTEPEVKIIRPGPPGASGKLYLSLSWPGQPPKTQPGAWLRRHLSIEGPALASSPLWPGECTLMSKLKRMILLHAGMDTGKRTFL